MQLTPFCLTLSCLRVSPDRSQFFRYDTVSLTCEDQEDSGGWWVKRRTAGGGVRRCTSGWGSASSDSTCVINTSYPADSGVYWCESEDGRRSNGVNVTVTDRAVILEGPGLPVPEGSTVTLGCKVDQQQTSARHVFTFYKDGRRLRGGSGGNVTIRGASKADEGLYKCSVSGGAESASSWLAVDASADASNLTSAAPTASCLTSVFRLACYPAVGTLYLLCSVLLGLVYRSRNKAAARTDAERKGSDDIIGETRA